jgi:3-oxoacyl-[acyl-carrier protein] reductase
MGVPSGHGSLTGRVALVTGASRGIGAAIARTLGGYGAAVAVNYVNSPERAGEVVADIEAAGSHAVAVQGDVGDPAAAERVVREAAEELGEIDILVCNAFGSTSDIRRRPTIDSWESVAAIQGRAAVQLACTLNCCHLVVPGMRARGGGSIILIGASGSRAGGAPGMAEIAVAKSAQDTVGLVLARELGPDGILVNTVAPGLVPTDANAGDHQASWIARAEAETPLGRVSRPEDVAEVVAMLVADGARQVTGAYLSVDGGRSLGPSVKVG